SSTPLNKRGQSVSEGARKVRGAARKKRASRKLCPRWNPRTRKSPRYPLTRQQKRKPLSRSPACEKTSLCYVLVSSPSTAARHVRRFAQLNLPLGARATLIGSGPASLLSIRYAAQMDFVRDVFGPAKSAKRGIFRYVDEASWARISCD